MSLPSLKKARASMAIFTIGVAAFVSVCCYVGLQAAVLWIELNFEILFNKI